MKTLFKSLLATLLLAFGSAAVATYWTCPDDSTKYRSKKKALKECNAPQKWEKRFQERRGLLGGGGIAGTGVGKKRGRAVDMPVEDNGSSATTQEQVVEDKGILGHGGIAGTGIGQKRYSTVSETATVVDEE